MRNAEELLRAIVADVEAMRIETPECDITRDGGEGYQEHWFGLSTWWADEWDNETVNVQWPNLGNLVQQAKDLLGIKRKGVKATV
jgi:hypothetical protein